MSAHPRAHFGSTGRHIDVARLFVVGHQVAHGAHTRLCAASARNQYQVVGPETRTI